MTGTIPFKGGKGCGHAARGFDKGSCKGARLPMLDSRKGGGGVGSGARKRKLTTPAQPLHEDKIAEITAFLDENGGTTSLGKLTTHFSGLKKVQVQEHFHVEEHADPENGDCLVSTFAPEDAPAGVSFTFETKGHKARKVRASDDPNAPAPPELDPDMLNSITEYLGQRDGHSNLGRLTSDFPGLKKAQLEPHFLLVRGEKETEVWLFGAEADSGAGSISEPKKKKQKVKKERDPNAPPPPPLDEVAVQKIYEYISSLGGSAPLGKVTTVFPGVKMVQLSEGGFDVTKPDGSHDSLVSIV